MGEAEYRFTFRKVSTVRIEEDNSELDIYHIYVNGQCVSSVDMGELEEVTIKIRRAER